MQCRSKVDCPQRNKLMYNKVKLKKHTKLASLHFIQLKTDKKQEKGFSNRGCPVIIWTGLNIKIGIVQKVYE